MTSASLMCEPWTHGKILLNFAVLVWRTLRPDCAPRSRQLSRNHSAMSFQTLCIAHFRGGVVLNERADLFWATLGGGGPCSRSQQSGGLGNSL
jgi:hypothetical protein